MIGENAPSARRRPGRRPNTDSGPRENVVKIRLSDDEFVAIKALAEAMKCSVQRVYTSAVASGGAVFGRQALVKQQGLSQELYAANRLLAAVGNNLNQITRAVNAGDELRPIDDTLNAIRACVDRINRVLDDAGYDA